MEKNVFDHFNGRFWFSSQRWNRKCSEGEIYVYIFALNQQLVLSFFIALSFFRIALFKLVHLSV